jgi:acyl dehydratase/NAD(P)-dependent dehydrogenase (short-subunit alcohol dehydrogenase family)
VKTATFQVEVTRADAQAFAALSGDWNPLHTDAAHAARTIYGRPVLHGAFSAGLISRLAGMHLPGADCLLHSMRLRFVAPILPPATLVVSGRLTSEGAGTGRVDATVADATTGASYVDATYEFSRHRMTEPDRGAGVGGGPAPAGAADGMPGDGSAPILVTGATGGLGRAVLARLGGAALGVSRGERPGLLHAPDLECMREQLRGRRIGGIVHCAWPAPDNERLLDLAQPRQAVDYHVAAPLRQVIALAQLLAEHGTPDAMLVLVGSTAAQPGRHNYRMPLYTLGKALVPELARILALELATVGMRCAAVVYDVIEGGMNKHLSASARLAHSDRAPTGQLPTPEEAAVQVEWLLANRSFLVSGATITLSGGALP